MILPVAGGVVPLLQAVLPLADETVLYTHVVLAIAHSSR